MLESTTKNLNKDLSSLSQEALNSKLKKALNDGVRKLQEAIKFIKDGADPNTQSKFGNTIAHVFIFQIIQVGITDFSKDFKDLKETIDKFLSFIEELKKINLNISNNKEKTPFQSLLDTSTKSFNLFSLKTEKGIIFAKFALALIELGADVNTKNTEHKNIVDILKKESKLDIVQKIRQKKIDKEYTDIIEELEKLRLAPLKRAEFITTLFILANGIEKNKQDLEIKKIKKISPISTFSIDILANIMSFFDSETMQKTQLECLFLARFVFENSKFIKSALAGDGIHIMQIMQKQSYTFEFFRWNDEKNNSKTEQPGTSRDYTIIEISPKK